MLYDAHIHLSDPEYESEIGLIINSMHQIGVKTCAVSMDVQSSNVTLELAKKSNHVLPFIGIHPEKASDDLDSMVSLIEQNAKVISGIGEIGLDKTYTKNDNEFARQKQVFTKLLDLAEKHHKPVSVHSRATLDEIFQIIPSYKIPGFLLHWFAGSKKQLRQAMDLGCYVSYGPVSVYSQDKQVLISLTNKDRILVETDGPVRFSRCFDMKSAHPSFIPSVVFCISKILGMSYGEAEEMLEANSKQYLGI
ncbi:TatD family hydrolase [Candidatus Nitrosotenuis aquarius]|uniref:TatD family hydrolase n=1 Tax=Candidatus Nitrosotenuis aquarius TaxID=1846278 RepID=UPI000C1E6AC4|nr:TatD family hydrolase [Candidatus Nitrosotenuis aquarius]